MAEGDRLEHGRRPWGALCILLGGLLSGPVAPAGHVEPGLLRPVVELRQPFRINQANKKRFTPHIDQAAARYGLDAELIHAVISVESGYNPRAVSPKGAMGLMQLMPATAALYGLGDPFDPLANIDAGTRHLRMLIRRFKNIRLALAAYNAGAGAVIRYGHNVPPYQETRHYVIRVTHFYLLYKSGTPFGDRRGTDEGAAWRW